MKKNLFEEEQANPLVGAGIFLGLIVLTAIICVILWSVTHKDKGEEQLANATETVQESSGEKDNVDFATLETEESSMEDNEIIEETQSIVDSDEETAAEPVSDDESMEFTEVADTVTAEDVTYEIPVEESDPNRVTTQDGRVIVFTDCDDYVRPKEYVNLRTEPSTSQGESTVKCQISHADIVHRTGYSADAGWSRVEFYGEILYVVSSYVYNSETTE